MQFDRKKQIDSFLTVLYDLAVMDEQLWQAVISRDASFDGQFVFAVSSTKVYCRPSCPSRRPRRERVSFFRVPEAAEKAGLDRKSTRLNSSHGYISYAVFCLKKKKVLDLAHRRYSDRGVIEPKLAGL